MVTLAGIQDFAQALRWAGILGSKETNKMPTYKSLEVKPLAPPKSFRPTAFLAEVAVAPFSKYTETLRLLTCSFSKVANLLDDLFEFALQAVPSPAKAPRLAFRRIVVEKRRPMR